MDETWPSWPPGNGYDLILVARRADRLAALVAELNRLGTQARSVPADLSDPDCVAVVAEETNDATVDVLINDACVGGLGQFAVQRTLEADLAMIQLNVTALVHLTMEPRQ